MDVVVDTDFAMTKNFGQVEHVQRGRLFRTVYVRVEVQVHVHDAGPGFWLERAFRAQILAIRSQ